jgi:hypothetical protein
MRELEVFLAQSSSKAALVDPRAMPSARMRSSASSIK